MPTDWREIKAPQPESFYGDAYLANEPVKSPLSLDGNGIWLVVRIVTEQACAFPDWRYATGKMTVPMQGGARSFFFEDPVPRDGPQPVTGPSVRGGAFLLGNCVEFIMTGASQAALANNVNAFLRVVETAVFVKPR